MEKTLTCDCGYEARAGDDEALAAEVQRHASQAHGMALSHREALLLVCRGEPTRCQPPLVPPEPNPTRRRDDEHRGPNQPSAQTATADAAARGHERDRSGTTASGRPGMITSAHPRAARPRATLLVLVLALVAAVTAAGTFLAVERLWAKPQLRQPTRTPVRAPSPSETSFGPAPSAAGFAKILVSVSNDFAAKQGDRTRLSNAHCVQGSRGHYMCVYRVARPGRRTECHLIQAEWAREQTSSFTVVLSGRVRRCGSVREAIRTLS